MGLNVFACGGRNCSSGVLGSTPQGVRMARLRNESENACACTLDLAPPLPPWLGLNDESGSIVVTV